MKKRKDIYPILFYIFSVGMLLFYILLASCIPYTHDDWDWGLNIGMQHLKQGDINSLYFGNLLEVCMTRSVFLKNICLGVLYWMIPFASVCFMKGKRKIMAYVLANMLLLCIPVPVWQQTVGWIAGAANFVTSAVCLILYYQLVKPIFTKKGLDVSVPFMVAACLLCFLMQLLIENLTLYMVGVAIFMLLYEKIVHKKWSMPCIIMLFASLLGCLIMFSGQMYTELFSTGQSIEGYRKLATTNLSKIEFIKSCLFRFTYEMMPNIWIKPWKISFFVSFAAACYVFMSKKRGYRAAGMIQIALTFGFLIFWKKGFTERFIPLEEKQQWICSGFAIAFFIWMGIQILFFFEGDGKKKIWLLGLWCSPCVLMIPTLFINALGPRIYFTGEMVEIYFFVQLLELLAESFRGRKKETANQLGVFSLTGANVPMAVACVAMLLLGYRMLHYGRIYQEIGRANRERIQLMEQCKKEKGKELTLPCMPHKAYLWLPEPVDEGRVEYFKEFYGVEQDVEIQFQYVDE